MNKKHIDIVLLLFGFFLASVASILIIYGSYTTNLPLILVSTVLYGISSVISVIAIVLLIIRYKKNV